MHKILTVILVISTVLSHDLKAQDVFSPFSIQGAGQLRNKDFINNLSMGGIGNAFSTVDSNAYSLKNPASSTYLKYTSLDFGIKLGANTIIPQDASTTGTYDDFGLNYISLAFPVSRKKGWTMAMGVSPFSVFGYNDIEEYGAGFRVEEHIFTGGLSEAYFNTAFRLLGSDLDDKGFKKEKFSNLNFGVQGSYLFGNKVYEHNLFFPESSDLATVQTVNNYLIRGFTYKAGLHYKLEGIKVNSKKDVDGVVKKKKQNLTLQLGAYVGSSANNRANLQRFGTSFFISGSTVSVPDTVLPFSESVGSFKLPNNAGLGFMFSKKDNWRIGADIDYTQWSNFSYEGMTGTLNDEMRLSFGGSYTPKRENNIFQRTQYKAGFNYRQSFLNQNNNPVMGYSTNFGLGLPFKKSMLNLGFEIGNLGNASQNAFQERFYNFYLGITINEYWFQRLREK